MVFFRRGLYSRLDDDLRQAISCFARALSTWSLLKTSARAPRAAAPDRYCLPVLSTHRCRPAHCQRRPGLTPWAPIVTGATMPETTPALKLTHEGAFKLLNAAIAKATEMNVPQCISIVDASGQLLAFARMDGAFALSIETSLAKAMTAAIYGIPTGNIAAGLDLKLAIATQG